MSVASRRCGVIVHAEQLRGQDFEGDWVPDEKVDPHELIKADLGLEPRSCWLLGKGHVLESRVPSTWLIVSETIARTCLSAHGCLVPKCSHTCF